MSSINRVLHTTTWDYFTEVLAVRFVRAPNVVKEEIMADINDLVQEFRMSSGDGAFGESFVAMCRLLKILQVRFDIIPFLATAVDLTDKNLQSFTDHISWRFPSESLDKEYSDRYEILFDGYRKMIDQSFSRSKDLGDMLRFLPGVVAQKGLTMEGMAVLYRINTDFLERLIKPAFEETDDGLSFYMLNGYLSGLLQDRDRSQLYYCDLELQHISICRRLLSLLDQSHDIYLEP